MKYDRFIKAALAGLSLALVTVPATARSEALQVQRGAPSSALQVPMNRAVVVESDTPFAELSIANPGIADISSLSDRSIYVLGKEPGRTTLTILGPDGSLITNVDVHVTPTWPSSRSGLSRSCRASRSRCARPITGSCCPARSVDRPARPGARAGGTLRARTRVEPDVGRRHAAGHAQGPVRRDAAHGEPVVVVFAGPAGDRAGWRSRHFHRPIRSTPPAPRPMR